MNLGMFLGLGARSVVGGFDPPPVFTVAPSITGTPEVGSTLTGTDGTVTFGAITGRQWLRDGVAISGATASTYLVALADEGSGISFRNIATGDGVTVQATSETVGPVIGPIPLTLPEAFPVTLQRTSTEYSVLETAATFFSEYTGSTIYVATTGNDTTGDGTSGLPYLTLDKAITEAVDTDIVSIAPGIYDMPSAEVAKDLAFIAPLGGVYLGSFNDLSTATITVTTGGWNIALGGVRVEGWLRTDATFVAGVRTAADCTSTAELVAYGTDGIAAIFQGASSSNVNPGNGESFPTLVSEGKIIAWVAADNQTFIANANVFIGEGITLASAAGASSGVVQVGASGRLVMDRTEVYGSIGSGSCISSEVGGTSILFGIIAAGAQTDNIDYRGASIGVEVGCTIVWPGLAAASNTSTAHDNAAVLRVGGVYRGGDKTINDIQSSNTYTFESEVGDPRSFDKYCIASGNISTALETVVVTYGNITFLDTFGAGGITNTFKDADAGATLTKVDSNEAWPY